MKQAMADVIRIRLKFIGQVCSRVQRSGMWSVALSVRLVNYWDNRSDTFSDFSLFTNLVFTNYYFNVIKS